MEPRDPKHEDYDIGRKYQSDGQVVHSDLIYVVQGVLLS